MASPSSPRGEFWRRSGGGLCAEGPIQKVSHPEDLCSLAGWLQRRQRERKGEREKKELEGGIAREDWA